MTANQMHLVLSLVRGVLLFALVWLCRLAFDLCTPDMPHWAQFWGSIVVPMYLSRYLPGSDQ